MGNREGAGIFVILAGIIVIVGAAKGTWRKLWEDVTGQSAGVGTAGSSSPNTGVGLPGGLPVPGGVGNAIPGLGGITFDPSTRRIKLPPLTQPILPFLPGVGPIWQIPNTPFEIQPLVYPYTPGQGVSGQGLVMVQ